MEDKSVPNILDHFQASRNQITPQSEAEFLGLQIARGLLDDAHALDYVLLSRRYTVPAMVSAFQAAKENRASGWPKLDCFIAALSEGARISPLPKAELIAFRIERRYISVAFFDRLKLEFARVRNLPIERSLAERAVARFVSWAASEFPNASLALESAEGRIPQARANRTNALLGLAAEQGISILRAKRSELFSAASHPAPTARPQFRACVEAIFPDLGIRFNTRGILDAAGLGLYIQCKRLLDAEVSSERE